LPALETKIQILDSGGYKFRYLLQLYVSRAAKKAFSAPFVDAVSAETLQECVREDTDVKEWRFYTCYPLSDSVRQEVEKLLG